VSDEPPAAERPASGNLLRPASAGADAGPARITIRPAKPSDYGRVIGRVNVWWGGRDMAPMLPKLFFIHFEGTSFVAEDDEGELLGFVCGFLSQTADDEAYIHFVGVIPEDRGDGLGRALYERFFQEASANGRSVVRCVTSPLNAGSLAFHQALGFEVERIAEDYDGPGEDRALLVKRLT
jgi:predicted GNAT superfamily acetyltransferase